MLSYYIQLVQVNHQVCICTWPLCSLRVGFACVICPLALEAFAKTDSVCIAGKS